MNYRNILVPVDFSINSVQAFDFALQLARKKEAALNLLHVIDTGIYSGIPEIDDKALMKTRLRNANEELRKFVDEIPHPGVEVIENLRIGNPHQQIITFSNKHKMDAIVIASHGWTGKYSLTTGSVAGKVIKLSRVPVICVKTNHSILKSNREFIGTTMVENWIG